MPSKRDHRVAVNNVTASSNASSNDQQEQSIGAMADFSDGNAHRLQDGHYDLESVSAINLRRNVLTKVPLELTTLSHLRSLDLSSNQLSHIPLELTNLLQLTNLALNDNLLEDLPLQFDRLINLQKLYLSGNQFEKFPSQLFRLTKLTTLYLGGNQLKVLPQNIVCLKRLEILYLGGNQLTEIPTELGALDSLRALMLCDNKIKSIPVSLSKLTKLRSLSLHNNELTTLPVEIIHLVHLSDLSLRNNPLVFQFVQELEYEVPTLKELSGRIVRNSKIPYRQLPIPQCLIRYLDSARRCPKCRGVYFDTRVKEVKFADFCGKYRLPLLRYLCSPPCQSINSSDYSSSEEDEAAQRQKMQRVLLGYR